MSETQAPYETLYGTLSAPTEATPRKPITLPRLDDLRARREPIAMLTAYDATLAVLADQAGVDCLLVGDSLGMVCQGHASTVPVSLEAMRHHTESVARGLARSPRGARSWLLADLPFGTYHQSPAQAMTSATVLMQAGAQMVKLEGGEWLAPTVAFLTERGIPVCAHLGLTPQSVHALGGYRVQGRDQASAAQLRQDAQALQDAGAQLLVLEMVPATLSAEITQSLTRCHTIGIGAGVDTAGQVLVMHDMLGAHWGKVPRFVHNFLAGRDSLQAAFSAYVQAVKTRQFPQNEHHAW